MLSLTSINGRPVAATHSQSPVSSRDPKNVLVYQPTETQLKELEKLIQNKIKNPILEMREQAINQERIIADSKKYKKP